MGASRLSRLWPELLALFREFDGHYDSQLFARQRLDELETEHEPIRVTIEGLYGTRNGSVEYDFGAIDADVLPVEAQATLFAIPGPARKGAAGASR